MVEMREEIGVTKQTKRFPIIGIGASAGGVQAMEGFFAGVDSELEAAFVIVTHLSPERESVLHEIVTRYTKMPVVVCEDGMAVQPSQVYVMPSNSIMTISDRHLRMRRPDPKTRERKPIDIFFSALAEDQGEYAVAVILSGGDGDGTLGAKAVAERGGFTIAQASDGSAPQNPHMPESAIASGVIDLALPVEQMGGRISALAQSFKTIEGLADGEQRRQASQIKEAQAKISNVLRGHSGHDFSGYKTKTFMRRVTRRLQVLQLQSLESYVEVLEREPSEVNNLFKDLLISVTNFFRDPEAFEALEQQVIPQLFEGRGAGDVIRVWVPGCATGEEVYSIAILLREYAEGLSVSPKVQIFATDIDESALSVARAGRYPRQLLDSVSEERRQKYFTNDGLSFVVSNRIREMCIFSPHSVIKDPPFSRMDLVSCRNLLIYLGPDMQNRVIPTFHYALKPGGYLFLGTSESISQHSDLFSTLDKKSRLFQARENVARFHRMAAGDGLKLSQSRSSDSATSGPGALPLRQAVEAQILDRYAPPHVVTTGEGDVVYYSARTGRYLEPPQGAPSRQLLTMAKKGLRLPLHSALREAVNSGAIARREHVLIDDNGGHQAVRLTVEPVRVDGPGGPLFLVIFEQTEPVPIESSKGSVAVVEDIELERELRDLRERLQSTIEEYETALEELKAANEELVSVNEEAQSSNEELEASKEEMQSLNEELNTINAELNIKVEDLDRANSDLKNLFESTQIATVFLDRNLVVRNFTPAASSFFNLRVADVGRPLTELSTRLEYPMLKEHIDEVFRTGSTVEHQLPRAGNNKHYLARLIPYRGHGGSTDGVVVTLVDVTTLAEAEEHQQVLISELNHRVKNMLAVVISIANHTLDKAPTSKGFVDAFSGRLHAMARAYGLLSRRNWKNASILQIVEQELEAFDRSRFKVSGSDLSLKPQQGLSMGMVVHELATNAAKYGALSDRAGRVEIAWSVKDDQLQFLWNELDGPKVEPPTHEGFGLSLVKGEIEYRMRGKVEKIYSSEGLSAALTFPLQHEEAVDG
jgi:two-component system, chemotaxis family, CheB/CheR fusion protein